MGRDSTPFFVSEIKQIFASFDPSGICKEACKRLSDNLSQEQPQDSEIREAYLKVTLEAKQMVTGSKQLAANQSLDTEAVESLLDNLDTLSQFAYKIGVGAEEGQTPQDSLVQLLLMAGNEQIIEYLYSENSDCNIKSLILQNQVQAFRRNTGTQFDANRFEITNQVPRLDVTFFKHLLQQ